MTMFARETLMKVAATQVILAAGLKVTDTRIASVIAVATELDIQQVTRPSQIAYVLATVAHECGFEPIPERRAKAGTAVWKMQERYWSSRYYGRGFPQLTWKKNYEKFQELINRPLVENPDLLLDPEISAEVLVVGMRDGLFTGVKLSDFLHDTKTDFFNARKIVNGTYAAEKVVLLAIKIQNLLF